MPTDKVLYEELIPAEFQRRIDKAPIAYLPLGTLEWHGKHMPLGSDAIQPSHLFTQLAQQVGGIVFPPLFFGPDRVKEVDGKEYIGMDCGSMRIRGPKYPDQQLVGSCYYMPPETFDAFMQSYVKQIARAGFKILVAHGHGPSIWYFRDHLEEFHAKYGIRCFHCWEFNEAGKVDDDDFQTDHGGKNETSLVMAARPELVQMDELGDGPEPPLGIGELDPRIHADTAYGNDLYEKTVLRMTGVLTNALDELIC